MKSFSLAVNIANSNDYVTIENKDIYQLYFIEDIFSFMKTGKLVFRDTGSILEFLPLTGGEVLSIEYGTPIDDDNNTIIKRYEFVVHKISNVEGEQSERNIIELFFIEKQHYTLHNNAFSLSFKNKDYTLIIKDILKKHVLIDKKLFVQWEDGNESIEFFNTSLKTPATNLKWLMERCSGKDSKVPGYLLYSNTEQSENSFNFITLDKLLQQKKYIDPDGTYQMYAENISYPNNIISYSINKVDNVSLNTLAKGIMLGYDIKRKKIIKQIYNYKDIIKDFTILGKYTLFDEKKIDFRSVKEIPTGETNDKIIDNIYKGNWFKQYCMQQTVDIMIKGHIERYAGGMIDIMWPSGESDSKIDKNMMGNFLIKSITHNFSPNDSNPYMQRIILIKNGYQDSDNYLLTKAAKKNVWTKK